MARVMKESGTEWLGQIPETWAISKIGSLYSQRIEKVSDKDYAPLSVTMQGILPQLATAAKSDDGDNRKLVRKGDFAINSRSDRRGSCGISPIDGSVSLINTILIPRGEMNPDYYNWLFHTSLFADEFYRWGHGIVDDLWTTRWQEMKSILVPVPKIAEQERIATYLDSRCAEVDAVLAKTRSSIEEYKKLKQAIITQAVTKGVRGERPMKESGIDWIGAIPSDWEIKRIKTLGAYRNGLTYTPGDITDEAHGTLVLRSSNVQDGKIALEDNVYVKTEIPASLFVKAGDILICSRNGSRELIGKNAVIPEDMTASFGAFMMIYRCSCPRYMYYVLNSDIFSYYLSSFLTATINQLTGRNFGNMRVVYCPDATEQQEIIDYLDGKCQTIDSLISKKENLVAALESYKKSLIYEYVTGKKEVPSA